MKIAIYGAGAIGAHLGGMLTRSGVDVSLIARGPTLGSDAAERTSVQIPGRRGI
jgi:2-dehydropantoate 2-reductase